MAASTMSRSETFGHYLLPLTMNKGHINAKQAKYHIEVKTKYLDLKKHRPERHALRNLLGMLHFRLGEYDESLAYFDKILSDGEDPENLNALANRRYICDKLYRFPEAMVCEEKMSKLLPDDYQNEEEESRLRRARGLAEQAFAYSFDVFDESVTNERYRTSVKLYEKAFELAGDPLTQDEKDDWLISKGMACHKIFNKVKWDKSLQEEARQWLREMVNIFIQITETTIDNSLASECWRQLGEIFQEAKSRYFIPVPDHFNKGLYMSRPRECFTRALHYTPKDPRLLARFANFFRKIRNKEEAFKYVNQSIQQDATVFNSFAFSVRGNIFLQDYKYQLTAWTKGKSSNRPDDSLLEKALNDFEKVSEIHSTPMNLEEFALLYYYMATDCHGNVKVGRGGQTYLQKALTVCARAAACQDGEKRPLVHKIRGQTLCALGEHQHSLRSFQRAIDCEDYKRVIFESGDLLIVEYGHILKDMTGALSNHQPLLADMVYWLHKAAKLRLSNSAWTTYSMKTLMDLTSHWQSFVKFCEDKDYLRKLEDIQEASLDPILRRPRNQRTVSKSGVDSRPPLPPIRHSQRITEEASGSRDVKSEDQPPRAPIESVKAPLYVVPHRRRAQSVTEEGSGAREANSGEYQAQIESATASMSVLDPDGDETSSEVKQITLTVNLTTGKTQIIDQTSSSQEWTSNDASNKPIRPAPAKAMNRDFLNDFFVIYSSKASEWVFRCLLEELEGSGLKGCIKDRDFIIGKPKLENYTDSIANSACIIPVITKDFANDDLCYQSMLLANDERKVLIPVLREKVRLPSFLNILTHLDATGAVDWERLKRCIEQQIRLE